MKTIWKKIISMLNVNIKFFLFFSRLALGFFLNRFFLQGLLFILHTITA